MALFERNAGARCMPLALALVGRGGGRDTDCQSDAPRPSVDGKAKPEACR